jgi:Putative peptidoglycan binding domain
VVFQRCSRTFRWKGTRGLAAASLPGLLLFLSAGPLAGAGNQVNLRHPRNGIGRKHYAVARTGLERAPSADASTRLVCLRYWLGPVNGTFGDSTEQAVHVLQKTAGLERDGTVGPKTEAALLRGVEARPRPASGTVVEVDRQDDVLMFVTNGTLDWAFNTLTGGGYTHCSGGLCGVADTPVGRRVGGNARS